MTFNEQNVVRTSDGRFSEKLGSAPEASLTLANSAVPWEGSRWDRDEMRGERPMRPYLPLHPADDDEFFDAPTATVLTSLDPKVEGAKVKRYQKIDGENWVELDVRGDHTGDPMTAGDLWEDLNYGDMWNSPDFKTAQLNMPLDMLFSDRSYYRHRDGIDRPLSKAEAGRRFEPGATFAVVSQAGFDRKTGTYRNGGVNERMAGDRTVVSSKNGRIKWDSGSEATIDVEDEVFVRGDDDIVIRSKAEYGVETVYRRIR